MTYVLKTLLTRNEQLSLQSIFNEGRGVSSLIIFVGNCPQIKKTFEKGFTRSPQIFLRKYLVLRKELHRTCQLVKSGALWYMYLYKMYLSKNSFLKSHSTQYHRKNSFNDIVAIEYFLQPFFH